MPSQNYVISTDRTARNTRKHLQKNPITQAAVDQLLVRTNPRVVISNRFGGRELGEAKVFVFPRYNRWTILISPGLDDINLGMWYGVVVLYLIEVCGYRPLQYMTSVQDVAWEEAGRCAQQFSLDRLQQ